MKNAAFVRYGAATAIGIGMTAALLTAAGDRNRAASQAAESAAVERLMSKGGRALDAIDAGLASVAQSLASGATLDGGVVTGARFDRAARSFFAKTADPQALVFFQNTGDNLDAAEQLAAPFAEGIARFDGGAGTFYLAASHVARGPGSDTGDLVTAGENGTIPLPLASSDAAHRMMGAAIGGETPVSSGLFGATPSGVAPVANAALMQPGSTGFWRFVAVRARAADGSESLAGVLGAFVDAADAFGAAGAPGLRISGPIDAVELPTGPTYSDGGAMRDVGVPAGEQGFVVSFPRQNSLPAMWWLMAAFGGLAAAAAALYTCTRENRGRLEAERRLDQHRREFKKRTLELKRSEDRFRRLAESTNVIPWAADLTDKRFTYIGPQIERISGYPAKSWCAPGFWVDHVHPADRQRVFGDELHELKSGDYTTVEYKVRSADGRVVHMRNMLTIVEAPSKKGGTTRMAQGYMLDITEMNTAQAVLDEARRAAEEANRSKSEFLANMSHELRTPLNAVIGFAEVMKDEVFGPIGERYQEYAENVHSSGKHLLSLINDVLDLSKIEAGKIELVEEETDLGVLLSKCRQLLHERASQAGLHIRLEIPAPLPFVSVDGRRIKQVILNLMSNSVKFTAPGGRITLRAEMKAPKGLMISVSDTGIGMSKEEIDVALEQFGQIDNELSRQHDGTGLGLPIARSLAELHGGSLEVESKKNVGTTVALWLPITRVIKAQGGPAVAGAGSDPLAEAG